MTPVSARSYAESGLPWFDLYDEDKGDIAPSDRLANVKSVKECDAEKGFASPYVIDCQKEFTDPQRHDGPGSLRVVSVRSKLPGTSGLIPS